MVLNVLVTLASKLMVTFIKDYFESKYFPSVNENLVVNNKFIRNLHCLISTVMSR